MSLRIKKHTFGDDNIGIRQSITANVPQMIARILRQSGSQRDEPVPRRVPRRASTLLAVLSRKQEQRDANKRARKEPISEHARRKQRRRRVKVVLKQRNQTRTHVVSERVGVLVELGDDGQIVGGK